MPIPEPSRYARSVLYYGDKPATREQQHEQLAAVYGVFMPSETFSPEEIARLRQIVAQHDAEHQPMRTIDLNNPPREPYRYQKFPKMVYDLERSKPGALVALVVHSEDELQSALSAGWADQAPSFGDGQDTSLDPKYQGEVERVEEQLHKARRKRTDAA